MLVGLTTPRHRKSRISGRVSTGVDERGIANCLEISVTDRFMVSKKWFFRGSKVLCCIFKVYIMVEAGGVLEKEFVAIKCQASYSLGIPSCGLPTFELARIAPT